MKGSPSDARAGADVLDWGGTARYEVRRRIGTGGMGVVYEAFDRERAQLVAVKTLLRFSPSALYRFKQEFRTLVDVVHPNLVRLHELVATDGGHVFFAMELIRGVDFLTHAIIPEALQQMPISRPPTTKLRPQDAAARRAPPSDPDRSGPFGLAPPDETSRPPPPSPADFARLRPALLQLVTGVNALHAAGKLHRDIKPSNVLVTPEGRVVLLDFGVATDLAALLQDSPAEREVVGTARYMAPEQATEQPPTTASDWYSVGAMLYEAMVGRPPFAGPSLEVLTRKSFVDAPAPSACVADVPADLDTLCSALLHRAPEARPTGDEILRWLGDTRAPVSNRPNAVSPLPQGGAGAQLIGRGAEMRALTDAFDAARDGNKIVTVRVHGGSGMGKSALVQHFVDGLVEDGEAVALLGRAYERESMPYKALDSVIDSLSRHLMLLAERDVPVSFPRDIGALAHMFPVLSRIEQVGQAPAPAAIEAGASPQIIRRRAIAALRELLAGLASRQPLVVVINDAQWGDIDSVGLLLELVRPPFDAPLLLLLAYRDEDAESSAFLLETRTRWPLGTDRRDVSLGPLGPEDARTLVLTFLGGADPASIEAVDSIARESGGSPLLIEELARSVATPSRSGGSIPSISTSAPIRLEMVVEGRMAPLSPDLRRLLELIAVSARPLPVSIVGDATALYARLEESIALLRARRFVRTGFRDGREVVEMVHDRIRETIVAQLSAETLRAHHGRLARVLEPVPGVDTEALAVHLLGAGENERAAVYAERAAEQAAAKLAFGQAIRLYRLAVTTIEALGEGSVDARRLRTRLGQVLERAGRGAEAAEVYIAAAARARGFERVELEREAAEQLLLCGHVDEGEATLGRILEAAGLRQPGSLAAGLASFVFYRVLQAVVGMRVRERETRDVRRVDHLRIEALYAVVLGLSFVNVIYGVCLQARHLYMAFRRGDRFQVLRASGIEAMNAAAFGGPLGRREETFGAITHRLARGSEDPDSHAFDEGTTAMRLFLHGRWKESCEGLAELFERYATTPAGWHANAQLFAIYSLTFLGRLAELRVHHAARLADAEERGDLYTTVQLRIGYSNLVWLVAGDVVTAREQVRTAMAQWSSKAAPLQRYRAILAEANIELYAGDPERAYELVSGYWAALKKSFLLRVQYVRADALFLFARVALASALASKAGRRTQRLAEASDFARKLEREGMPWTAPLAALVRAGVASARGERDEAARLLRDAIGGAEKADMLGHAHAARMRLGALVGGDEGEGLLFEGREWMTGQGVREPARFAAMFVPGIE